MSDNDPNVIHMKWLTRNEIVERIEKLEKEPNNRYDKLHVFVADLRESLRTFVSLAEHSIDFKTFSACSKGIREKLGGETDQVREDLKEIFKPRYEVRRGRFGLYFYDNKLNKDLDLHEIIIKLRKLEIYEEDKKK